ncbi:hypothetical protein BGW39_000567 [Mortierella sp. 14UC]|nr:hypothetical protein BGW39_000567 [Mortierella sp. 14UC]
MDSACNRFFSIPELVASLTPYLKTHDIIQLSRTSRAMRTICSPLSWQDLNLKTKAACDRLLGSPGGLQAFGHHVTSVRSISWRPTFSCYYLYTLWAYLNVTAWPSHRAIATDALSHKEWGGMLYAPCLKVLHLPPMLRLTRFTASLTRYSDDKMQSHIPEYNHREHFHQILWLVRLNCHSLTYLELSDTSLDDDQMTRDFARTLSQLYQLRTLRTSLYLSQCEFKTLFLSCPGSLVDFQAAYKVAGAGLDEFHHPCEDDWDFEQGPLVLRQTPLPHLKRLSIPVMPYKVMPLMIRMLLEQSPALETLSFPYFKYDEKPIVEATNELCPRLSELIFLKGGWTTLGPMIRDAVPVQQMKSPLLQPHRSEQQGDSRCLDQTLDDTSADRVSPKQSSLEQDHPGRFDDLRGSGDFQVKSLKFLDDQYKSTWTEVEHRHWDNLGKFYSQIGSLTELEILNLKTVERANELQNPAQMYFPGLFALEDVAKNEIGHLSKWAGLVKLRELRGSVNWTLPLVLERIGKREVDWFVEHMPALRVATFVLRNNNGMIGAKEIRAHLKTLEKKRPELRFSHKSFTSA